MKHVLESTKRGIKKVGFLPWVLGIVAIFLAIGSFYVPWLYTSFGIAQYNQAVDEAHALQFPDSLKIMQFLWHEGTQNAVVREASAYNVGTLAGAMKDPQAQTLALQALTDAVRMNPDDERAKENLEILLRRIAQQKKSADQGKSQQGNDKSGPHDYNYNKPRSEF